MANRIPQVVVVTGPQRGARAPLNKNIMVIGRTAPADLCINENVVSRQQAQLMLTHDGWVIENLSKNGFFGINDKAYKPGKKLLIETGDIISVGQETKLLFIDTDQDPQAVINQYLINNPVVVPQPEPEPEPVEPEEPKIDPNNLSQADLSMMLADQSAELLDEEELQAKANNENKPKPEETQIELSADQLEAEEKNKKRKKLYAFLGIYFAVMIIGLLALITLQGEGDDKTTRKSNVPKQFTSEKIRTLLAGKIKGLVSNEVKARESLRDAKSFYAIMKSDEPNAYRSVLYFKLFNVYRGKEVYSDFLPVEKDGAEKYLHKIISENYKNIVAAERSGKNWELAKRSIKIIQKYLPRKYINEYDDKSVLKLINNIDSHNTYIANQIDRAHKKK